MSTAASSVVHPVVVIPGITAAHLADEYPFRPETVWGLLKKDYERIVPHPENRRYEAIQPARVVPSQLNSVAYSELTAELRHNLSSRADRPTPVFAFAYDWRMPLARSVEALSEFIEEVIERTALLNHYHDAGWHKSPRVHLTAHSMGGLVAAGYLERHGSRRRVSKVVSLATPFRGSFEAVLKIAVGTGDLGSDAPSSRERQAARLLPSLYHLIPNIGGAIRAESSLSKDLFHTGAWQPGVIETLSEFIRLHGCVRTGRPKQARRLFAALLTEARRFRRRVDGLELAAAGLRASDWLCLVGVNAETRVRLRVKSRRGKPDFSLRSADRENRWQEKLAHGQAVRGWEQRLTGDGTVPFEGAVPSFLDRENLVCVTPQDFGYWELGDRVLGRAAGFHGILPNMNMLHRLIVRHLTGSPDPRGHTWGRPAPGVSPDGWRPPVVGLRNKDLKT